MVTSLIWEGIDFSEVMRRIVEAETPMLNLIEAGTFDIVKHTKHGIYINYKGSRLFLPNNVIGISENDPKIEPNQTNGAAAAKSYEQYRARLWGAMVRLYNGGRDGNFIGSFARTIDQQLTVAWNTGADDVGVAPDEMTAEDMFILEGIINNENDFIEGVMGEIDAARANQEYTREQFDKQWGARVDLWAQRYPETVNRARMHFGSKQRLEWRLGATEKHCTTCARLNGIVAFGYEWEEARIQPQAPPNSMLACSGWRCDCSLSPTTRRRTGRALDRLLEIGLSGRL